MLPVAFALDGSLWSGMVRFGEHWLAMLRFASARRGLESKGFISDGHL